jgi:MFS family permease
MTEGPFEERLAEEAGEGGNRATGALAALLLATSSLWFLGEGMLGPLFAIFSEEIGGDVLEIAALWAAFLVTSGICTATIGAWADRNGRHELFSLIGYVGNAVVTFGYLLVDAPWELAIVQVLLGLCSALATPTWYVLYVRSISSQPKRQGFWLGLSSGQEEVATGVAALLGGLIVTAWGFRTLFVVMGCVQLVAAALQLQAVRRLRG